jgi:hypothetical protein
MSVFSTFQLKSMLSAMAQEAAHFTAVSLNNSGMNSPNPTNKSNNTGSEVVNENFNFSTNPFSQQVVFSGPGTMPCGNTCSHDSLPMHSSQQQQFYQ